MGEFNKKNAIIPNKGDTTKSLPNIFIAEVKHVGKLTISDKELSNLTDKTGAPLTPEKIKTIKESIKNYNADEYAIKIGIPGAKYDGSKEGNNYLTKDFIILPNCFPLMPKHINFVPKKGEIVLVMLQSDTSIYNDRFYIGPITSSLTKLNYDPKITALSNFSIGTTDATEEIDRIPLAKGVYEDPQNVTINGRGNTDIIQRNEEILLRCGKFVSNNPLQFNSLNPGFIQIKSDFNINIENSEETKKVTVTNIVSDKINLLTYNGSPSLTSNKGLTSVKKGTNIAEYINDDKLEEILTDAHPLVFGDTLVAYLKLIRTALLNHVHNGSGHIACDITPSIALKDFSDKAEKLENAMLSKNIRIN
jgi:hypothetical protein